MSEYVYCSGSNPYQWTYSATAEFTSEYTATSTSRTENPSDTAWLYSPVYSSVPNSGADYEQIFMFEEDPWLKSDDWTHLIQQFDASIWDQYYVTMDYTGRTNYYSYFENSVLVRGVTDVSYDKMSATIPVDGDSFGYATTMTPVSTSVMPWYPASWSAEIILTSFSKDDLTFLKSRVEGQRNYLVNINDQGSPVSARCVSRFPIAIAYSHDELFGWNWWQLPGSASSMLYSANTGYRTSNKVSGFSGSFSSTWRDVSSMVGGYQGTAIASVGFRAGFYPFNPSGINSYPMEYGYGSSYQPQHGTDPYGPMRSAWSAGHLTSFPEGCTISATVQFRRSATGCITSTSTAVSSYTAVTATSNHIIGTEI